jgi:hypothetical protein
MHRLRPILSKGLLAVFTFVWLLSCVGSLVDLQCGFLRKFFVTEMAGKAETKRLINQLFSRSRLKPTASRRYGTSYVTPEWTYTENPCRRSRICVAFQ